MFPPPQLYSIAQSPTRSVLAANKRSHMVTSLTHVLNHCAP
jgi:hypothetical protein